MNFVQSQTRLYTDECGPDNPLRCYVGDVSLRTNTIGNFENSSLPITSFQSLNDIVIFLDMGGKRVIFSDQNFPLEGDQSAIGRSIVLYGPNFSDERFACANIEPDHDIVKYINLQRPPKFVV